MRKGQPGLVLVHRGDRAGPFQQDGLQQKDADGARAEDQHPVGEGEPRALHAVEHAGERLHEGAGGERQLSDVECGLLGNGHELRHAPREGHADRLPLLAEVLTVRQAGGTIVAGDVRLHGNVVAGLETRHPRADGRDDAGELVARDDRVGAEVFAAEDVDVGAADPARPHLDQELVIPYCGDGDLPHGDLTRLFNECCLHGLILSPAPGCLEVTGVPKFARIVLGTRGCAILR